MTSQFCKCYSMNRPNGKFKPLVDFFNFMAAYNYSPRWGVSVDENFVGARGRKFLLKHMLLKAPKFGTNFLVLAESA